MPTDLIHLIGIAAPADTIYRDITTEEGIRAWWTTAVRMDDKAGGMVVFSFFELTTVFQMRISAIEPFSLVRWQCTGGSAPDWVGTWQEFILEPQDGEVLLKFCHGDRERVGSAVICRSAEHRSARFARFLVLAEQCSALHSHKSGHYQRVARSDESESFR